MHDFDPHGSRMEIAASESRLGFTGLTEFQGLSLPATGERLPPGTRLGDVTIVRFIAEGGMGCVYEALQGVPCRTVAVKVIRPGLVSAAAAKRFEHEAHILGRLAHPGIARIYSLGWQPMAGAAVPYFVMEFIEDGVAIPAYAARHGLGVRERVALFREACRAIAHGHQRGVIHRDLKPGNMLVDAQGQPKVIDFGVARSTDGDTALTTMHTDIGRLVGTLQYMSPEQFDGSADDLDVRADVYSLGVVLYELLAGRPPYDLRSRALHEVASVVRETEPQSLSTVSRQLRGDLNTIVTKCLEKDRGRRYSSAAELEADLGRFLAGQPIAATPPSLLDALVRLARRHRVAAASVAALGAAFMVAMLGISIFAVRAERQREVALQEKARADEANQEARRQLYAANLRSLQACSDARNLRLARRLFAENASIVGSPLPLEMQVMAARLDDALVTLDLGRRPVTEVAFSRDGTRLEARSIDEKFMEAETEVYRGHPTAFGRRTVGETAVFAVGPGLRYERRDAEEDAAPPDSEGEGDPLAATVDGGLLAVQLQGGAVQIIDGATRREVAILEGCTGRLLRAEFSADGSRLAVQPRSGAVGLWDTAQGRLLAWCGGGKARADRFAFSPDGSRLAIELNTEPSANHVIVCETGTGRQLCTIVTRRGVGAASPLFVFSPDGGLLATAADGNGIQLWDSDDGEQLAELDSHASAVMTLAFSADGSRLAGGAVNGHVHVWDARSFEQTQDLRSHDGAVLSVAFHPDGEWLASGSQDGTVRIWSARTSRPLGELSTMAGMAGLAAVAFSPDGRQLAVAAPGAAGIELWDPGSADRLRVLPTDGGVIQIAYGGDGALLAAACVPPSGAGEVRIWESGSGTLVATLGGHARGVTAMAFSPAGDKIATVSGESTLTVWDARAGKSLFAIADRYRGLFGDVAPVFGLDGLRMVHRSTQLLDAATGKPVADLARRMGHVTCMASSPDGRSFAAAVATGAVELFDFETGKKNGRLMGHSDAVRALAFSGDGSRLLTAGLDGTASLWDVLGLKKIGRFSGHEGQVTAARLTPDGRRVVTSATDGTVRVWDVESGSELLSLPCRADASRAIALSPDGRLLVTTTATGAVRLWGLSNAAAAAARQPVRAAR